MAAGLLLASAGGSAWAADHVVGQKNRQFQKDDQKIEAIEVKPGDAIVFKNDDRIAHNVFSRSAGSEFDLGTMKTGEQGKFAFNKDGTFQVECAIHPNMQLKVAVK
jgi:plastocyanin